MNESESFKCTKEQTKTTMEDIIFIRTLEALDAVIKLSEGSPEPQVIEECAKLTRQLIEDIKNTGGLPEECKLSFADMHQAIENLRWQLFLKSDQHLPCVAEVIKKSQLLRSTWITSKRKKQEEQDFLETEKSKERNFKQYEWYHSHLSREAAESVLQNKPGLTFLVRKSSQEGKLAVSYVSDVDLRVHHVLISFNETHLWLESETLYVSLPKLLDDKGLRVPYTRRQLKKEFPHLVKSKKKGWKPLYEGNIAVGIEILE